MPASDLADVAVAAAVSGDSRPPAGKPQPRPPSLVVDLPEDLLAALDDFFGPRATDVDAGRTSVRDGITELARLGAFTADLPTVVAVVARVARHDLASAFSAWAHRMAVEYLAAAPLSGAATRWSTELQAGRRLGATAMAAGTAHVLAGTPLPVAAERKNGQLLLRGRVPWASNLLPPFVVVTAAVSADSPEALVVALSDDAPGLRIERYPDLLALGATGSSSIVLDAVPVGEADVLSHDLGAFVDRILAPFLLLQSAFCLGLADRSLDEAAIHLGPFGDSIRPELAAASTELERLAAELGRLARRASNGGAMARRDLLALRLAAARLAGESVGLELAAVGGRAFVRGHPTERRIREAAFLPIQSPTEILLRWLLSREA